MNALGPILLLPVGRTAKQDLENLATDLAATGLVCTVGRPVPLPQDACDRRRNQYLANALLGLAARTARALADPHARVLAVTEAALYAHELNFVFGIAQSRGRAAVISLCRLGLGADPPLRRERVLKEAVHELGHTLGLNHCPDAKCVMHFSNSLADTDRKESVLCPVCQRRGGIHRAQLSTDQRHATIATTLLRRRRRNAAGYNWRNRNSGQEGSMPMYEFRCEQCGEIFEQRETIAEHETAKPECPKCGGEKVALAFSALYANTSKKS